MINALRDLTTSENDYIEYIRSDNDLDPWVTITALVNDFEECELIFDVLYYEEPFYLEIEPVQHPENKELKVTPQLLFSIWVRGPDIFLDNHVADRYLWFAYRILLFGVGETRR